MIETPSNEKHAEALKLQRYFDTAPEQLAEVRQRFAEISRAPNAQARERILVELVAQVKAFKFNSALPELYPVSQLALVLENLLQRIVENPSSLNLSVLRTTAAAVVLLETMSVPGLKPDLATNPPVKLLAVDDDPISRIAVSSALRKAFKEPDMASEGDSALTLAATNAYELIFLDVEMPGMNGYELCTKIHETSSNRTTPIVFVTSHSDFESRSKSSQSGGQDLIGKPFLDFELTLKALTIVLRNRLQAKRLRAQSAAINRTATAPVSRSASSMAPALIESPSPPVLTQDQQEPKPLSLAPKAPNPQNPVDAFFTRLPTSLEAARGRLQDAGHESDPDARKKALGNLLEKMQKLRLEIESADLRPAARLTSSLETLLARCLEDPRLLTPSTLNAGVAALNLLEELCTKGVNQDLTSPDPRVLVVDDDAVVRLAMSNAVQSVFGKPENANSGQEALALAEQTSFDVIFLDVEMPGMDGFAACARIHATTPNARTPIVFVTNHSDMESRGKAALAGCCGFMPKPALPAEITLRTLTFALRGRLEKFNRNSEVAHAR